MDKSAIFLVDENVGVMSVLYLEYVAHQRVRSQWVCKVVYCRLKRFTRSESNFVKVIEVHFFTSGFIQLSLDVVDAKGVIHKLDNTTVWTGTQDLVWLKLKFKISLLENEVNGRNQLHCKLFRTQVISTFDYNFEQFPGLKMAIFRLLSHSGFLRLRRFIP